MTKSPASEENRQELASGVGTRSAAPPWASGIVAGVETAVLSAGLVFAFVFAATAAAPSVDGSISADWSGAWDVGTSIWLLAHGVPTTVGNVTVTLIPLGLTLIVGVIAASVAKRVAVPTQSSVAWAALTYGVIAAVASAGVHGGAASGWRAGIIGGMVTGVGASLGLAGAHGFRVFDRPRLPEVVSTGIRLGAGLGAVCVIAGTIQAMAWLVAGADNVAGVVDDLSPDSVGGLTLAVGEAAYLPTLSVWGLAWLSGAGFDFGPGTHYAPGGVDSGPIPNVPLFASLPGEAWEWPLLGVVVLVGLGVLVRLVVQRWLPEGRKGGWAQVVAVGVVGLLIAGATALSSGSAGGEPFSEVGPDPIAVGWRTAVWVGIGLAVVSIGRCVLSGIRTRSPRSRGQGIPNSPTAPERPPHTHPYTDPLRLW